MIRISAFSVDANTTITHIRLASMIMRVRHIGGAYKSGRDMTCHPRKQPGDYRAILTVNGKTIDLSGAETTVAGVNSVLAANGVAHLVHVVDPDELQKRRTDNERLRPAIEDGRRAYWDCFNPNGPDASPKCPYVEGSAKAKAWWRGWHLESSLDAPDSY